MGTQGQANAQKGRGGRPRYWEGKRSPPIQLEILGSTCPTEEKREVTCSKGFSLGKERPEG